MIEKEHLGVERQVLQRYMFEEYFFVQEHAENSSLWCWWWRYKAFVCYFGFDPIFALYTICIVDKDLKSCQCKYVLCVNCCSMYFIVTAIHVVCALDEYCHFCKWNSISWSSNYLAKYYASMASFVRGIASNGCAMCPESHSSATMSLQCIANSHWHSQCD